METVTLQFDRDVESVFALMVDPAFLRRRREAAGELNIEVDVETLGDTVVVTIARDIEADIPSFAKKVFSPRNHVVDVTTWRSEGEARIGTYVVTVGKRIEINGEIALRPTATGCEHTESFEVSVRVALIGKRLAAFVARETTRGIQADGELTRAQLIG